MADRGRLGEQLSRTTLSVIVTVGVALAVLTAVASWGALRSHGRAFPGLFIDPHASFSTVWWPAWGAKMPPVKFPDRLVAIEGEPVTERTRFELPAQAIAGRLATLRAQGATDARLTFESDRGLKTVTRPLRARGADETLFYFGLYALVGLFVLWSGLAVLVLARRRAGAVAYATWCVGTFVFLVTFYDYHSSAWLAPLFSLSTVSFPLCVVWLAYSFPEPPRAGRRVLRGIVIAFTVCMIAVAAVLAVGPYVSFPQRLDLRPLRGAVVPIALSSLLVLSISILYRLRVERGRRRQELLSSALGLAAVPALIALGYVMAMITGTSIIHILLPFLVQLMPLSVGYALIRNNVLETSAVLSRRMFIVPVLTGGVVVAIIVWLVLRAAVHSERPAAAVPWVGAAVAFLLLVALGARISGRLFFAATARFRPTLQQLADDLASKGNARDIGGAIQEAVMRWLPTEQAEVLSPGDLDRLPHRPDGVNALMDAGTAVWTTEPHWRRHLLVPMRSQGGLRGILKLAPKHEAALYTREDLDLLETISSLGAVALHNAEVFAELEAIRRLEADVARDDKRLTLAMLGAEMSHEIAYPLNFLRYLLRENNGGAPVDTRDLEAAREEIGRLERMFATLHRLKIPEPRVEPVLVLPRALRALDLVREIVEANRIAASIDIPPDLVVVADPDRLVQIFANLLRNAVQAVPPGSAVGIRSRPDGNGTSWLEVWDEGPGIAEEIAGAIFDPFVSGKQGGMGLGLAVTQRLVRGFGWNIGVKREDGRTIFGIEIPPPRPDRGGYY
jgi:signal transduction histidine kinase